MYTYILQENMERIFDLTENRDPSISDQNIKVNLDNQWVSGIGGFEGLSHTEETKKIFSKQRLGVPKKNKKNYKGPKSESHKENMRKAFSKRLKKQCPNCGGMFAPSPFKRYHNENCHKYKGSNYINKKKRGAEAPL